MHINYAIINLWDKEKEEISWMKFWIGVGVASMMGLISWFVNNYEQADIIMLSLDILSVVVIAVFIVLLNNAAIKKIRNLENL